MLLVGLAGLDTQVLSRWKAFDTTVRIGVAGAAARGLGVFGGLRAFSAATSGLERIGVVSPPDYRQRISEEFRQGFRLRLRDTN